MVQFCLLVHVSACLILTGNVSSQQTELICDWPSGSVCHHSKLNNYGVRWQNLLPHFQCYHPLVQLLQDLGVDCIISHVFLYRMQCVYVCFSVLFLMSELIGYMVFTGLEVSRRVLVSSVICIFFLVCCATLVCLLMQGMSITCRSIKCVFQGFSSR